VAAEGQPLEGRAALALNLWEGQNDGDNDAGRNQKMHRVRTTEGRRWFYQQEVQNLHRLRVRRPSPEARHGGTATHPCGTGRKRGAAGRGSGKETAKACRQAATAPHPEIGRAAVKMGLKRGKVSRKGDNFIYATLVFMITISLLTNLLLFALLLRQAYGQAQPNRLTPLTERMIADTATGVPPGLERSGAFHVDRLPCNTTLYLLPCRHGRVFAARAYIVHDDFSQIAGLARDAKLAILEVAGTPLYTRLGRIVWRTADLEVTLYVGHRVIEIGTLDLHRDWR